MRFCIFIVVCMVLVPSLVFSGSITHTFTFSTEDVSFSGYNGYDVVRLRDGVSNGEVGHPLVPFVVANFVIPAGAEVVDVSVVSKEVEGILGVYDLCPVQTPRPFSLKVEVPFTEPDAGVYAMMDEYPGKDSEWFHSGSMGGYRIAGIFLYPLQYIPAERRLRLATEVVVRIEYEEGAHEVLSLTQKQIEVFGRGVNAIVENVSDVERFAPPVKAMPLRACDYAIITNTSHSATWQRLADWKNAAGYTAQVFTTTWIYSNYTGSDNPERIRNFLKDYFTTEGLIYAVLAGDVAIVPERDAYSDFYSPYYLASDYYYSDLDGTWDGDGDGRYGEIGDGVDGYFDIFVGRPPVDDTIDIKAFLHKDSVYIFAAPAAFVQKLLLPSEQLFSGYHGRIVNNAIGDMFPGWTVTKLEDGNAYPPHTRNAFNENYNLMHISAHGNSNGTSVFTSSDVPFLTNIMPTIMNAISCYSGDFDQTGDCFAERLMNKSDGAGCVAVAMNSRYGWGTPPSMGPSERMDTCFFAVMLKDTFNIGIIHGASKNHFRNLIWSQGVWHYCGLELNLFGDPEMQVKLTQANEPYVYISDRVLNDDNNNGIWDPGEYAELIVTLSNGGSVDASNVQAVLRATTNSQYVDISDSTSSYGTISAGGSASNASDPFKMTADAGTPNGTVIGFTLHVTADGGYSWDYNFTYAVGNPPVDYYDHDIGNVRFTVTNRGICGFMNDGQTQGSGFHYPISGSQHLFIGSVWAGNASNYVVNRDYSAENSGDWQQVAGVYGDGTVYSDQDSWAQYNDAGMGSPKGITCTQKGWAWSDPGGQDFVIVEYTFRNDGSSAVNGLYFGQFMDWDVGDPYSNTGGVDNGRNLIWMYGSGTKYAGVGLLYPTTAANVSFIYNPDYVWNNSYILDSDKIQFLNGSINQQSASPWDDWGVCVTAGPFNLSVGDSSIFAVVILGGEGVSDVQQNYDSAKVRYPPVGVVEKPKTPRDHSYFNISKVYPEPFSKFVNIEFTVPQESRILLHIYDASGRLIKTLINSKQSAGRHSVKWNGTVNGGKKAASGVYFCQLIVNGSEQKVTRKLLLVK